MGRLLSLGTASIWQRRRRLYAEDFPVLSQVMATALVLLNHMEEVRFSELISCGAGEMVFTDPGCVPASSDSFPRTGRKKGRKDRMTRRIAYSALALSFWTLLIVFAMSGRV
jgi:hypothetical protein